MSFTDTDIIHPARDGDVLPRIFSAILVRHEAVEQTFIKKTGIARKRITGSAVVGEGATTLIAKEETRMGKFVITTALALVLAGGAYAQDHRGGGIGRGMGGGGMGGGGMSAQMGGGGGPGGGPSMMSRGPSGGPSGPSSFGRSSSFNGPSSQGRTLYNQERGNRDIRGDMRSGQLGRGDRDDMRHGQNFYNHSRDHLSDRDNRHLYNRADRDDFRRHDRDIDHHHGVVSGNFFEHGRHFRFRRFFHGEWVFLTDWDDCTAWAWVHVAPGVWAWRPIDVCIG